jgi:PucR family transcriptional regulator, purine catabolism regulatory protein
METDVFTLRDFLELKEFPHQVLLTPGLDPGSVVIRHVSVIEAPIERFVRRDELVLTTVLGCRDSEEAFLGFMRDICDSGAAAVAVSFPEDRDELVPPSVLAWAESRGVPVVRLPWAHRFAEITETVVARLRFAQAQKEAAWEAFEKRMLQAYLLHQDIGRAAELLARELGAEVLITDFSGRPVADTRRQDLPADRPLPEGVLADYRLVLHINSQGQDVGFLYMDRAHVTERLAGEAVSYSSYILTPLLLWFVREDISRANRRRALDDFIRGLATGELQPTEDVLSRGRSLGLRLTRPYYCVAASLALPAGEREVGEWLDDHQQELCLLLEEKGFAPMLTIYLDHIVAYAEADTPAQTLVERLRRTIGATFPELHCVWGVSDETGSRAFDRLYREARLAADLCRREEGAAGVYRQRDVVLYRLVKNCLADADSLPLRRQLTAPLLEYDAANAAHLEEVLLTYLRCGGNACKTAQALHFHRQALRYRLRKIEELLGISLDDHERLLEVELCLRMRRFADAQG